MSTRFDHAARGPDVLFRPVHGDAELRDCHPLVAGAGPHAESLEAYTARLRRLRDDGYQLVAARADGQVVAVAGYRPQRNLVLGDFLHIDLLAALANARGQHWGARLLGSLMELAADAGCGRLVLDPALSNSLPHRFYSREGMESGAIRFSQVLNDSRR